jgi:hypothetical protein
VRFKLAILNVLAKRPGGRATLDEVRREVGIIITNEDQTEQLKRFSALGDIDIFRSGWVLRDEAGLLITDAGLLLLHSLGSSNEPSLEPTSARISQAPVLTDDLTGAEDRLRIFDLELRTPDNDAHDGNYDNQHQSAHGEEKRTAAIEASYAASQIDAVDLPESTVSKAREGGRMFSDLTKLIALIAAKKQLIFGIGRRYFAQQTSLASNEKVEGSARHLGRAAFAFLSMALAVACVVAAIAFGQIQSLKSDISVQRRDLLSLKERIARLEQIEKEKRDSGQHETEGKSEAEKTKPFEETRTDQPTLILSREEIQLIRDYIKPAPAAGIAAPAINVGDPVGDATIPLPSHLTEKIPKLLGARFTTRNGAIIITKRNSQQADAVLAPN